MKTNLAGLEKLVKNATGPSDQIDQKIYSVLDGKRDTETHAPYTASVDECISLITRTLPDWHWHVGHGPMGVVPYASMFNDNKHKKDIRVEASAPTVPLALLGALIKALMHA